MIIKKLIVKLNDVLRNRHAQEQVQAAPQAPQLSPPQLLQQQLGPSPPLPPPMPQQQIIQQPCQQQLISHSMQKQILAPSPPPPVRQPPKQQFASSCDYPQAPFPNEVSGGCQYEYEEVPCSCPCCQVGGHYEEMPCPCCQDIQYEEVPCPCCEQQQPFDDDGYGQGPMQYSEPHGRPQFPQSGPASPSGPGTPLIPTGTIYTQSFMGPLSERSEGKICGGGLKEPNMKSCISQGSLMHLPPSPPPPLGPMSTLPPLPPMPPMPPMIQEHHHHHHHRHVPQGGPSKGLPPQIVAHSSQGPSQQSQQPSSLIVLPRGVQVQTFVPPTLHSSFFSGFPSDEQPPPERIVHKPYMSPRMKEILQASNRDAC